MRYRFANCVLDDTGLELFRDGAVVPVEPQVFDLLHLLVRFPGQLVTRDQIIDAVWQGRIVSESAISVRISAARRAVGDDGKTQAIIRTVPRRGLRVMVDVRQDGTPSESGRADRKPTIRFARARDGLSLAWARTGQGPPVLRIGHFPSHLELDWQEPGARGLFDALGQYSTLIRFDHRGSGLSDRDIAGIDYATSVDDIKTVADAAGLDRFALFGTSGSGAVAAIQFAATYPDRISGLVLLGSCVEGRELRQGAGGAPGPAAGSEPIEAMIREGWDQMSSPFLHAYLSIYFPDLGADRRAELVHLVQQSSNMENMLHYRRLMNTFTVEPLLSQVQAPTLVLHSRGDAVHPLAQGRRVASGIRDAELVVLDTADHYPSPDAACWSEYLASIDAFLRRHNTVD